MLNGLHINKFGDKMWYKNGFLHRLNGPASIFINSKYWYCNGLKHRLDGPAVEDAIYNKWYYFGDLICCNAQEEFERYMKLMVLL